MVFRLRGISLVPRHSPLIRVLPLLVLLLLPLTLSALSQTSSLLSRPPASATPSSYSWPDLRTDTVNVTFSVKEKIWSSGTGVLDVKTRNNGTFSDTASTTATITIPEGVSAGVYVCGDDHYSRVVKPCDRWYNDEKWLRLYVDDILVYSLGREYWWSRCYSKAATLAPGNHTVKLVIYARVTSYCESGDGEWYVGQGFLEIWVEGGGRVQASSHSAEAVLNGAVTHSFTFRLPEITGVRNMSWKADWNGFSKAGSGAPGSIQTVSFEGVNRDQWVFTSPVVIRVGEPAPSVDVSDNYVIDAVYDEGSEKAGVYGLAVALNNGDEVGFTSAKYLVTEISRDTRVIGGTLIGSAIWANSNSTILFNQTVNYYGSTGWVTEKIRDGVETGSGTTRIFGELNVSRVVGFSSKNRSDELELTTRIPQLTLVFTHIKISAERNGNNVNARACWAHDNTPIAGLRVRCFETGQSSVTDLNGFVSFTIVGSGFRVTICPLDSLNGITIYEEARVGL
ncbi:MAG: hypothetical protein QW797_09590 [Thermoproteota archaeon]